MLWRYNMLSEDNKSNKTINIMRECLSLLKNFFKSEIRNESSRTIYHY